jgi:hypothetical protein
MSIDFDLMKELIDHPGLCPKCHSINVKSSDVCIKEGIAHAEIRCTDCHTKWQEDYALQSASYLASNLRLYDPSPEAV